MQGAMRKGGQPMPEFIDVHTTMQGVAPEALAEAHDAEAVHRIHERAGHPADNIYQVSVQA